MRDVTTIGRSLGMSAMLALVLAVVATTACHETERTNAVAARQPVASPATYPDQRIFAGGVAPPSAGGLLINPLTTDRKTVTDGGRLFTGMNCDGCHGGGAVGWVGPSLTARRWRYGGSDGAIFRSIHDGRPHGMPAFGGLLSADMIWRLVTYIKSLPPPGDVATESW